MKLINFCIVMYLGIIVSCSKTYVLTDRFDDGGIIKLKTEFRGGVRSGIGGDSIGYEVVEYDSNGTPRRYFGNLGAYDMPNNFIGYYCKESDRILHKYYILDTKSSFDTTGVLPFTYEEYVFRDNKYVYTVSNPSKTINGNGIGHFDTIKGLSFGYHVYLKYKKDFKRKIGTAQK